MNEKNDKKKIKDVKLPLINSSRKNNIKQIKTTTNKNKDTSSKSILSQNSLKANSVRSSNLDKKPQNKEDIKLNTFNSNMKKNILRPNTNANINKLEISKDLNKNDKADDKINEIINDVNKTRNIKTKVNNNNINNKNGFNSSSTSKLIELNNNQNKLTNKKKKYKFKIYKPLNPLLAPHEDMSFIKDHSTKENFYKKISSSLTRMTKKDLNDIKKRRNERLEKEKKQIENSNRKIMNDIKGQNSIIKSREIVLNDILNSIGDSRKKMSQKNAQKILEDGGMIEAYKYLIKNLCKNGMPEGNVYDYCSDFIKNFERVWQKIKFKMLNKQIEEHFRETKEKIIKEDVNYRNNKVYKALEQREEMRFIKKFDKSRSSLHIMKKNIKQSNEIYKNNDMKTDNLGIKKSNLNEIIPNKKEENKNMNINNEIKAFKTLERKNTNKTSLNERNLENLELNNLLSKKSSLASNKVTFNIKLKKNEDEEKQNEEMELNQEKEKKKEKSKEIKKEKSKEIKKEKQKENEKTENEINSTNPVIINTKVNEIKDKEIQKEKKKPANKKDKKGKTKEGDNS